MSGLRILTVGSMYPPHHLGGAELIWRSAVEHLRRRGHEVRVLTTDYRAAEPDPSIAEDPDVHRELRWYWHEHEFPRLGPLQRVRLERHNGRLLARHLRELAPDAVCWWSMGGMSLSLLERVRDSGPPAVGVLLDDWLVYGPEVDGWLRLCRRLGPLAPIASALAATPAGVDLGAAAHWVFMSETVRRHARQAGVDVSDSEVVQRGIDASRFAARADRDWRGELICLGRIDPRKGIGVAIGALEHLSDCRLLVLGDGDRTHLAELERQVRERGLEGRVEFRRAPGDRIPQLLAATDALLFPVQWEEPWGLVPLEAMASGVPVVATGTGGSGEYLRDGENCLIYAPREDPRQLAAAVARLRERGLRERLRAGGARTAAAFSEGAFNDGVEAAIDRVAR